MRWILVPLAAVLTLLTLTGVRAVATSTADWELTGLREPVLQLITPGSGAFFAVTQDALVRSDDGGSTWVRVALPPSPADQRFFRVAVDPGDHRVIYAAGAEGLYRTTDDAASWTLVVPTRDSVLGVAVSGARGNVVYLALTAGATSFRFLRSSDGGATWEQLEEARSSLCLWGMPVLEPHPTDAQRVFRTAGCYAGRDTSDWLRQSTDQGATWSDLLRPRFAFPGRLVGGQGVTPGRFYLAANRDQRAGGATLYASVDDGITWTEALAFEGGGTAAQSGAPNIQLGGLAYDPLAPDRVYIGLAGDGRGVRSSADGGSSWLGLGREELGAIHALALGVDRSNLYAATDQGLWRVRLQEVAGE
jgi:photosystem II stability/assembly factor-like uncharacterized protein